MAVCVVYFLNNKANVCNYPSPCGEMQTFSENLYISGKSYKAYYILYNGRKAVYINFHLEEKKMKKILALLLAVVMVLSLAACGKKEADVEDEPVVELTHFEKSQQVYDAVLGEFEAAYNEALAAEDEATRYALMAIAEAKLLGAGVFLPTTSQGGNYAMTKVAPYTNTPVLWGNDTYRYHDRIVVTEPIEAAHVAEMKAKWAEVLSTGTYEQWVKDYLTEKGYTIKDTATFYFDADPATWDVLITSMAADSEILVNTYDGLVEYDMENQIQPALAESWEVSDDGLTYTFKIREGINWVDNQNRVVAPVKADDFVAGLQHMLDGADGLQYLVCAGCANIVNTDEYVNGDITDFSQVGVKALDDYTLQYTLTTPTSYFMTMLGYGVFAPMSRSFYESMGGKFGAEYDPDAESYKYGKSIDTIAYCGPFVVTNFTSNSTIAFEANESYWNADGNNLKAMTFMYTDGSDQLKPYDDFFNGVVDTMGMTAERVTIAKERGTYDKYSYISDTDATSYCGFLNVNRSAYANYDNPVDAVSTKSDADKERSVAALANQNFRLALVMSIDRVSYNAQSVGDDLAANSLINSYVPGTYCNLPAETTVKIGGVDKTYAAGTMYGQILQDALDADGIALKVWNGQSSAGFDGWYNPTNAATYLDKAIAELAEQGIEISAENPIYIDMATRTDSQVTMNMKQVVKQSVEAATGGKIKVNLVECATRDIYLAATYRYTTGDQANFDINDGSGWGPDYGDPSTYLGTMLPDGDGYMTKSLGLF